MSDDILQDVEKAFKRMNRMWQENAGKQAPWRKPLSYQRFKVLRVIDEGFNLVPEICDKAGLDRSTTASILREMLRDGMVGKKNMDHRAFLWTLTDKGRSELERTSIVLDAIMIDLTKIFVGTMEDWI